MCLGILSCACFFVSLIGVLALLILCDKFSPTPARIVGGVVVSIAILLALTTAVGHTLWAIAPEQIEQEIDAEVHSIDGVQYIQYTHPGIELPIIKNVNDLFNRRFDENEKIKVRIHSRGPYNGFYRRPETEIVLPEPAC